MVSARLAAVSLLPSPFSGLVITIARTARPCSACSIRVRSERYCSAASECGASAATSRGSSGGGLAPGEIAD